MSSNETISDKLLRAIDAAIDDGNYQGVVSLAKCWQRLVPSTVWSCLGLTQADAEVAEEIAAATADHAPDPERLKFGQIVQAIGGGIGVIVEDDGTPATPYRVFWRLSRSAAWCGRADLTPIEPQS